MRATDSHKAFVSKAAALCGVAAFWLAVWTAVSALVAQPLILPGPLAVAEALARLVLDGATWLILLGSGARILCGLSLAAACGGALAGASVRSRIFEQLVSPALSFIKATPVACVVVLLLIWLGSARVSVAAVFLMALPGVYFSLREGLSHVDASLGEMFRLHGVRGWRLFCAHTWRGVLPFVLSCARSVIGMSWKAGVAAELIGMAQSTVGERIYQAKLLIETADLLAWTVLVVAVSWACERVLVRLLEESGAAAWRLAVRAHGGCSRWHAVRGGHGARGARGVRDSRGVRDACERAAGLSLAVGDRAPWAPALRGLSISLAQGERVCVMGPSGVGKSTLLAFAAGECRSCSMVFQETRLVEEASALDNVLVCADAQVDERTAAALLRLLVSGIDPQIRASELSGGQRRRVEIARALLCPGDALILDEPFVGLDPAARDATAQTVLDLLGGRTLILATHDPADAQALDITDITTLDPFKIWDGSKF